MPNIKRTERGWAGHFICASSCLFRRNTLLELGDVRVVVSTVGNMVSPPEVRAILARYKLTKSDMPMEKIGHNHHYETMAFGARFEDPYWDADVQKKVRDVEANWRLKVTPHKDGINYADYKANMMHEAYVAAVEMIMLDGTIRFEYDTDPNSTVMLNSNV